MVSNSPINSWDSLGLCDCGYDDDESIDDFMNNWFGTDIDGFPQFGVDNFLDNQPSWLSDLIIDPLGDALSWTWGRAKGLSDLIIGEDWGAAWGDVFSTDWAPGPTGGYLPRSLANGLKEVSKDIPSNAAANGMHAWHAGSNAYAAQKLGLLGAPSILAAGIIHETPLDWGSFRAEERWQGTINHALDSATDIIANITGMTLGYFGVSPKDASNIGNYIPGPGEPDPAFGWGGGPYNGNPSNAWGQYP